MKRRRLTRSEESILEQYFISNPFLWDRKAKVDLSKRLKLETNKIYKYQKPYEESKRVSHHELKNIARELGE